MKAAMEKWETLATHLRSELEEYGELLQELCAQQECILKRDASAVLEGNVRIEAQAQRCERARACREQESDALAEAAGLEKGLRLKEVCQEDPELYNNLIEPLADAINGTIERTRRKAAQNQLLLGRACQIAEQLIQQVQPEKITRTYTRKGALKLKANGTSGGRIAQSV